MDTKNTRPIFPWYKERLHNKYLKVPTNKTSWVEGRWRFVNVRSLDGLNESSPNRISKTHACFSKQMSRKQIRREYVAGLEEKLTQHPLALYPHYKDHMSPELFDKVVSVLDPDVMCTISSSALPAPALGHVEEDEEDQMEEDEEEGGHYTEPTIPDGKQSSMTTCLS